jgi:hypothetical protein
MASSRSLRPLLRTFIVLGAVGAITTTVTFTALQSQNAVLSSNTISTATAFLLVSNDGTTFNNTKSGFTFSNVTPGGAAVPASGYNFYLKNTGTANLAIKLTLDATPSGLSGIDTAKVFLNFSRSDNGFSTIITLKTLIDSMSTGAAAFNDTVNGGTTAQYSIKASMASDAYSGTGGGTISGIDLVFSGVGS